MMKPAPIPPPVAQDVADFLGRGDDAYLVVAAAEHVGVVTAFVRAYTRGVGFTVSETVPQGDEPVTRTELVETDLAAVIVAATARLTVNPAQVEREQADGWATVGVFNGFSLPELVVLNSYRRRTA